MMTTVTMLLAAMGLALLAACQTDAPVVDPPPPAASATAPAVYADADRAGFAGVLDALRDRPARDQWDRAALDQLADRLEALFDDPGPDPVRLKEVEVRGVAADLRERASVSPPQIAAVLGTLLDPEQDR